MSLIPSLPAALSRGRGLFVALALLSVAPAFAAPPAPPPPAVKTVETWGVFEQSFRGPSTGNPFLDVQFSASFTNGTGKPIDVPGFYDGNGTYKLRFSPPAPGEWKYTTHSNKLELAQLRGSLRATPASGDNHGPVSVQNTFHFAYADGKPFYQIGTTCYAWTHEPDRQEEATLATLKDAPFNKVRMCVLPTRFPSKRQLYPYVREGGDAAGVGGWDYTRFNPEFFQHLDKRVADLAALNIQADIIIWHPYETKTGFNNLDPQGDERYVRYLMARLGAYRNVWWSLANEFDLLKTKEDADWDRLFQVIAENDPYQRLRSIHNCKRIYNNNLPWVTHASIQNGALDDFGRHILYRDVYNKPIVFDEVKYEGDVPERWGNLKGEEMVLRFWHGTIDGTYVGHGETYRGDQANWISNGGKLEGTSHPRLAFLKKIFDTAPDGGIDPIDKWNDVHTAGKAGQYYLIYFGREKPTEWTFELPKDSLKDGMAFSVDVLDTWDMTVTPVEQKFTVQARGKYRYRAVGEPKIDLPGKPYMALRITRAQGN